MGQAFSIQLDGEDVPIEVKENTRAKRLILRVSKSTGVVTLTLPPYTSQRSAERFLTSHKNWIARERREIDPVVPLGHGDEVPFLGDLQTLVYAEDRPRSVKHEGETIIVGGPVDMAGKRLENWMKREAKTALEERSGHYASLLGVEYKRISIGDMKSRWGSCSETGTLRYNWRLILAPFEVLDYVAAHEVAHLLEMNHSDRFWGHVERCIPDHKKWRKWLRSDGSDLFRVCFQ